MEDAPVIVQREGSGGRHLNGEGAGSFLRRELCESRVRVHRYHFVDGF